MPLAFTRGHVTPRGTLSRSDTLAHLAPRALVSHLIELSDVLTSASSVIQRASGLLRGEVLPLRQFGTGERQQIAFLWVVSHREGWSQIQDTHLGFWSVVSDCHINSSSWLQIFISRQGRNFFSIQSQVSPGTPLTWRSDTRHSGRTSSLPRRPKPSCSWCGKPCKTSRSSSWRLPPSSRWACPSITWKAETVKVRLPLRDLCLRQNLDWNLTFEHVGSRTNPDCSQALIAP